MRKTTLALAFLLVSFGVKGQTLRTFTLENSADGQSTLTCFLPEKPTGRAVVACPGGGYSHLAMEHEGTDWAPYFNAQGIAYFVLKYRMPHGDRSIPISDAEHAMTMVRDSAEAWHVNPYDVGIMGSSAGGHLASTLSTQAPFEARPNFSILFYPVITMNLKQGHQGSIRNFLGTQADDEKAQKAYSSDRQVRRHLTPPCIIMLANNDRGVLPVYNGVAYYSAMRTHGNDAALYVYPTGGHGFGFRPSFTYHEQMLNDLTTWLRNLPSPREDAVRVACIGNSITDGSGVDMQEEFAYPAQLQQKLGSDYFVKNYGVSARTMLQQGDHPYMKEMAWQDAKAFNPNVVVIKLGTNDSKDLNWKYGYNYQADLQAMIDTLSALPARPIIFLATPIPAFKNTWTINDSIIGNVISPIIKKVARHNHCEVIDFHTLFAPYGNLVQPDGIHPTAEGCGKMADMVSEAFAKEKVLKKARKREKKSKRQAD